jgi:hypothetical protein
VAQSDASTVHDLRTWQSFTGKESEQISEMNQQMLRRKASRRGQKHADDSRLS